MGKKGSVITVEWDAVVRGLHLRTYSNGQKAWFLYYRERPTGSQRRPKLGEASYMSVAEAREVANTFLLRNARGLPPRPEPIQRKQYATKKNGYAPAPLDPRSRAKFLVGLAKKRAAKRAEPFFLNVDFVAKELLRGVCARTGERFILDRKEASKIGLLRHPNAPSIDRIDTTRPYSNDNAQVVTLAYNLAKGEQTDEELQRLCVLILRAAGYIVHSPASHKEAPHE